jgi:hypothetical protein
MRRLPGHWEFQLERSAAPWGGANINLARVFLNNSVAHGKSQASAAPRNFSGEERIKNSI